MGKSRGDLSETDETQVTTVFLSWYTQYRLNVFYASQMLPKISDVYRPILIGLKYCLYTKSSAHSSFFQEVACIQGFAVYDALDSDSAWIISHSAHFWMGNESIHIEAVFVMTWSTVIEFQRNCITNWKHGISCVWNPLESSIIICMPGFKFCWTFFNYYFFLTPLAYGMCAIPQFSLLSIFERIRPKGKCGFLPHDENTPFSVRRLQREIERLFVSTVVESNGRKRTDALLCHSLSVI